MTWSDQLTGLASQIQGFQPSETFLNSDTAKQIVNTTKRLLQQVDLMIEATNLQDAILELGFCLGKGVGRGGGNHWVPATSPSQTMPSYRYTVGWYMRQGVPDIRVHAL